MLRGKGTGKDLDGGAGDTPDPQDGLFVPLVQVGSESGSCGGVTGRPEPPTDKTQVLRLPVVTGTGMGSGYGPGPRSFTCFVGPSRPSCPLKDVPATRRATSLSCLPCLH